MPSRFALSFLEHVDQLPAKDAVLAMVRQLDEWHSEDRLAARAVYAQILVVLGPKYLAAQSGERPDLQQTLEAGRVYLAEPSEAAWGDFYRAATTSYPFGPGEGCFSVPALGTGCGPGAGCRSGAGGFVDMAYGLGYPAVRDALRRELGRVEPSAG